MFLRQRAVCQLIITIVTFMITIVVLLLCVGISSINSDSMMNGTQSGRSIAFFLGTGIVFVLAIISFLLNPGKAKLNLSIFDLLLFSIVLFVLFLNDWSELKHSLLFLELSSLAILYLITRQQSSQVHLLILVALSVGGVVQAVYGNLQLWGYFPSNHGIFKMTGSFYNPGPYAGYLATVFPISLGLYLFNVQFSFKKLTPVLLRLNSYFNYTVSYFQMITPKSFFFYNNSGEKSLHKEQVISSRLSRYSTMKSFFLISIFCICLVLPASRSRAAWLAFAASTVYLISVRYNLFQKIKSYFNTYTKNAILIIALIFCLIIAGAGLYHFKKGSADGRRLIWKISAIMIRDKPAFGFGFDGFKKHYMDYQANYFKENPESNEALVAGDTNYAFNELIQLTVENGVIGILPHLAIVLLVFFKKHKITKSLVPNKKSVYADSKETISNSFLFDQTPVFQIEHGRFLLYISRAVILSIVVFGLFSYPLQILPIKLGLVVALAISACTLNRKKIISWD